jgi:hypothetical protein
MRLLLLTCSSDAILPALLRKPLTRSMCPFEDHPQGSEVSHQNRVLREATAINWSPHIALTPVPMPQILTLSMLWVLSRPPWAPFRSAPPRHCARGVVGKIDGGPRYLCQSDDLLWDKLFDTRTGHLHNASVRNPEATKAIVRRHCKWGPVIARVSGLGIPLQGQPRTRQTT